MDNEKLIELVTEYTFLYDLSDRRYSDNQRKDDAWKEIGKKLQVQDTDCKKAWALLRDAFRRAIKKQKETKSGQASGSTRKWKYEEEMSFLLPYFKERPTLCTVTVIHEDKDNDAEANGHDEDPGRSGSLEVNMPQKSPPPKQTKVCETTVVQPSNSKKTHVMSGQSDNTPLLKRTRIRQISTPQSSSNETPSTALMKFILENRTKSNEIQQFFDGIATTVQSFPPRDRAIAKAKVFSVISQMEFEILGRDSNTRSEYVGSPASYETQMSEPRNDFYSTPSPHSLSPQLLEVDNATEIPRYTTIQEQGLETAQETQQTPTYTLTNYFTSYDSK